MAASSVYCNIAGAPLWGFSTRSWMALGGLAIISHLLGWMAINYALGHISSTEASIGLLSQSVLTAVLANIILGEVLVSYQIGGGIIVLAGIGIVYLKRSNAEPTVVVVND